MNAHLNANYRIGVDTLENGKVRARARGRKTNTRTFPAGTEHAAAAEALARKIEGERFAHVRQVSGYADKTDWATYVA